MIMTATTYTPHPAAELFPMLPDDELQKLADDIQKNRQREPIKIDAEGRVLDGRNRLAACQLAGVEPLVETWDGKGSPTAYALSLNLRRRHLDPAQLATVAARAEPLFAAEAAERRRAGAKRGGSAKAKGKSRANVRASSRRAIDEAAAAVGAKPRSAQHAKKVLADGAPALVKALDAGQVSVSAAAAVATLPVEEQAAVVAAGPAAVATRARTVRETIKAMKREVDKS
ncbi:MAG: hypothetical protein KY444_09985, partial [Gemmatimonadetes bacterium]|nr:hypothetical protein [Gemmatimonadota bacterium]